MDTNTATKFPDGVLTTANRSDAIDLLGGTKAAAARVLGYTTRQSMTQWPEHLDQQRIDQVNGALIRIGVIKVKRRAKAKEAV